MKASEHNPETPTQADAVVGWLTGWLFILVGAAAVAASALIPGYFDTLDLQDARATQAAKAELLADERQRYEDFHQALLDDDPVLIERLAISELRLKPVDTGVAEWIVRDPVAMVDSPGLATIERAVAGRPMMRSIENELSRPDLKCNAELVVEHERPRRTRLVAVATGENRPWVAGFGALMLLMGLWPRRATG